MEGGGGEGMWREAGGRVLGSKQAPLLGLNVDWESCLSELRPTAKELLALDVVIHLILHARIYNRRGGLNGFSSLSMAYILSVAGEPGRRVLQWLLGLKCVECDNRYRKGDKALGYLLTRRALGLGFSVKPMPPVIVERLGLHWQKRRRATVKAGPAYAAQWKCLQTVTLDPAIWPVLLQPTTGHDTAKTVHRILMAFHIEHRNWFFCHDEKTGRCFSNVSNFPSDLRQYLRIGGQQTRECDIVNSQPTLLCSLAYRACGEHPERDATLRLVRDGKFYSALCGWAGKGDLPHKKQKRMVFAGVLFAKDHSRSELWPAVQERVPVMAGTITAAKLRGANALALQLQKLEADIMLGRVFPRLTSLGIHGISLHDGCLVPSEHTTTAASVIAEEFAAVTGITPTVRIKDSAAA